MLEFETERQAKKKYRLLTYTFRKSTECFPARVWLCIMMFTATWTVYTARLQFGSIIPAMLDPHGNEENKTRQFNDISSNISFPEWSGLARKYGVTGYGLGNVPGNLIGGTLSMNLGPRRVIFWTSLVAALVSLFTPMICNFGWMYLAVSRFVVGLMGGVVFPACHTLVSAWAPPTEKSRFVWSLLGGTAGSPITLIFLSVVVSRLSWELAWIIPSIIYLCWLVPWLVWAYNTPSVHPFISDEEKEFILKSQEGLGRKEKLLIKETPLGSIFTSIPFLSLVICHFGNLYLLFFYQNYMITYLQYRGASIEKGGFLASLPWLCRVVFGFFFSWAGDHIRKMKIVSLTIFRKCATFFSHFIPGVCLLVVGHVSDILLANLMFCLALGCNGAASISNLSNNQDLSPNYAGFLYGVMNFFGTTAGVVMPFVVEGFIHNNETDPTAWQKVFYAGGIVCIACMVIFVIGGSAEIQKWNNPNSNE